MAGGRHALAASLLLLAVAAVGVWADAADETEEVFAGQINCAVTGVRPTKPRALSFCFRHNEASCGLPANDAENAELFATLTDTGLSCRIRNDIRDHPLAKLYCMNCDAKQPRYMRNAPSGDKDQTLLICKSFAERELGDLSRFDACGLIVSGDCLDANEQVMADRDRYVCGDDLVIPSQGWNSSLTDEENWENFLNYPNLGTPGFDDFYYKIVDGPCSTTLDIAETNPACLLSEAQLNARIATYQEDGFSGSFTQDELCFNSAGLARVPTLAALVLALVAALWALA